MSVDDELRRRMQAAADRAGAGVPENLAESVNQGRPRVRRGGMSAMSGWKYLGGLAAAGLIGGGALGFTVLQSDDDGEQSAAVDAQQYSLYGCPDGAQVGSVYAGDRVFVIGRDESGGWYEVRDPRDKRSVVWVPSGAVDPDAVTDVPVHDCAVPSESVDGTAPASTDVATDPTDTTSGGTPDTTPGQQTTTTQTTVPVDTTKPTVLQPTASPNRIYDSSTDNANCPETSTLTVQALDNVGVTQVTGTYSGLGGSPKAFSKGAGNSWSATFGPFSGLAVGYEQSITITIVARDAAGNTSNPTQISVIVDGAGNCLG